MGLEPGCIFPKESGQSLLMGCERKGGVKGDSEVLGFSKKKVTSFVEYLLCVRILFHLVSEIQKGRNYSHYTMKKRLKPIRSLLRSHRWEVVNKIQI